jgi:hypothetical protein
LGEHCGAVFAGGFWVQSTSVLPHLSTWLSVAQAFAPALAPTSWKPVAQR